eukprot:1307489-Amphidinium_carterae.1
MSGFSIGQHSSTHFGDGASNDPVNIFTLCCEGTVDTAYIGHLSRVALGGLGMAVTAQYNVTKVPGERVQSCW